VAFTNYSELQTAIANWLMRDDLTTYIPDFVTLCESRCNRRIRVREMEDTETMTPSSNVCTLPDDYLEARRVTASTDPVSVLTPLSLDMAKDSFNVSGYPTHYVIQGSTLTAYPLSTNDIVLDYYAKIPALASNTTNWLLDKAPEIYLYGSLLESAPFMEDDNRLATWISLFKAAVDELLQADTRAMWSKATARIRGVTP
jgi:hypothetical protein